MSGHPPRDSEKPGHSHVGLIDGMTRGENDGKPFTGNRSGASRLWMVLAIVFFVISLGLAAYVAYVEISESLQEEDVPTKFPGFFRTEAEQAAVEKQIEDDLRNDTYITPSTPVNTTNNNYPYGQQGPNQNQADCEFVCYGQPAKKRKRRAVEEQSPSLRWLTMYMTVKKLRTKRSFQETPLGPPSFHGCCISRHKFVSPETAENTAGTLVKVAQFNNKRQYFPTQECKHAKGCTGCGCGQENAFLPAVIENEDDNSSDEFVINLIKLPGCCKCFNNFPPP